MLEFDTENFDKNVGSISLSVEETRYQRKEPCSISTYLEFLNANSRDIGGDSPSETTTASSKATSDIHAPAAGMGLQAATMQSGPPTTQLLDSVVSLDVPTLHHHSDSAEAAGKLVEEHMESTGQEVQAIEQHVDQHVEPAP
ncbi:hypothetical protein AAC387_Pa06g2263 [Persea americana]